MFLRYVILSAMGLCNVNGGQPTKVIVSTRWLVLFRMASNAAEIDLNGSTCMPVVPTPVIQPFDGYDGTGHYVEVSKEYRTVE